jgi:murein DD-endopeptidase MepM/ murein hydrolase activator NlpD
MYRPLVSNHLTQRFGANKHPYYKQVGMKGHSGLDFRAIHGEEIFHAATFDGVMKVEKDRHGGIGVDVISKHPVVLKDGTKSYVKCRYWHLKAPVGWDGKEIKFGDTIGLADNTGVSSGTNLHFGLKKCDKNGKSTELSNGYYGGMDPLPYMELSHDAEESAKLLNIPPLPLTAQERQEINSQLSMARKALLLLRKKLQRM